MIRLSQESWIEVRLNAIAPTPEELKTMWESRPQTREEFKIYGKTIPMPRFQKLYGSASYSFSRITLEPDPEVPSLVKRCIEYASKMASEHKFTGALVNWYMDGADSISPHADDEIEIDELAPIFSFNFGGRRDFEIKAKAKGDDIFVTSAKIPAHPNSVFIMGGAMQREYVHSVPKTKDPVESRINVTVRALRSKEKASSSQKRAKSS